MHLKTLLLPFYFLNNYFFRKKYPFYTDLRLTNRCNLKCLYCDVDHSNKEELSTKKILSLIDQIAPHCIFLVLSGGEPLLKKDIEKIINYAQKKEKIFVLLCSNGILIKEKIREIEKIDLLSISLDGPLEIHDKLRGTGSFDYAIQAIKEATKHKLKVITTTVLNKTNINSIEFITSLAKKENFRCFFQPIAINSKDKLYKDLVPSKKDFQEAIEKLVEIKNRNPDMILNSLSGLKYMLNWPNNPKKKSRAGTSYCFVDTDGKVYPCFGVANKQKGQSFLKEGFTKALKKAKKTSCKDCWCLASIEIDKAFHFDIKTIFNILKIFKKNEPIKEKNRKFS